jgi:hypothetical protein
MNAAAGKLAFASENERLLEKARATGTEIHSFDGWKSLGKWVKKGERQKSVRVRSGNRVVGIDPITGEDRVEPVFKYAYGFTADQVK